MSEPFTFLDSDPEDAYDASDPVEERLRIIGLIIASVNNDPDKARRHRRRNGVVRLLNNLTAEVAGGD